MSVKLNVVGGATKEGDALAPYVADKGEPGPAMPGPSGNNGWTPVFAGELDGVRTLMKVVDWTGGAGAKPTTGMYIGPVGYVTAKADAFNYNVAKRFGIFTAVSNAQGIATVNFGTAFADAATAPGIAVFAIPAGAVGAVKPSQVAGSLSKAGVQIKVEGYGLVSGLLTLLAGATVTVFAAEQ